MIFKVKMEKGELWWGGSANDGKYMPFGEETAFSGDFRVYAANQTMPLYISNHGRVIWSETPFGYSIKNGELVLDGEGSFYLEKFGNTLREAHLGARAKFFPLKKRKLNRDFFKTVQYNTWIECLYNQTQEHILRYAHAIVDNGFEPGILMIDEGWHGIYGHWDFDRLKFPDPKSMVDELHSMGFKVMLWVVPYVCPDGEFFIKHYEKTLYEDREHPERGLFIRRKNDPQRPALFSWWNGFSAMLNFANPKDREFLDSQLRFLMSEYGIDGFKFDGGTLGCYANQGATGELLCDLTPAELNMEWNKFAQKYDYHEYKDTYCGAAYPTIQRLCDRTHSWSVKYRDGIALDFGLDTVIPCSIAEGLIGHPFICPDMVGGGSWHCFLPGEPIDGELFVRWAQLSALFPMMQYSKAPWDILSKEDCDLVIKAGRLHKSFTDEIIEMVTRAEETGEPILRCLEYNYPDRGYAHIKDEFMLEDKYLVAPIVEQGATERRVIIPEGEWIADDGTVYTEGEYTISAPIDRLIYFKKR